MESIPLLKKTLTHGLLLPLALLWTRANHHSCLADRSCLLLDAGEELEFEVILHDETPTTSLPSAIFNLSNTSELLESEPAAASQQLPP